MILNMRCVSLFEILKKKVKITFMEKRVTEEGFYGEVKNGQNRL